MNTLFGGMDASWADHMDLPAQRTRIVVGTNQGIRSLSKERTNVVNFVSADGRMESDAKKWQREISSAFDACKGYDVRAVIENEPCMLPGYSPKGYCSVLSSSLQAADGYGVRLWHGGLIMHQAVRMTGESITDQTAYKNFRSLAKQYGVWGGIQLQRNGEYEANWIRDYAPQIGLNYHFQHFADLLPQVNAYLLTKGWKLMNNELSWRGGDTSIITKLMAAVKGTTEITIWDNVPGKQGYIVPLGEQGERLFKLAM